MKWNLMQFLFFDKTKVTLSKWFRIIYQIAPNWAFLQADESKRFANEEANRLTFYD